MGAFKNIGRNPYFPVQTRIEQAIAKLKAKGVEQDNCPRCMVFDWNVDILDIPVNSAMASNSFLSALSPNAVFTQESSHRTTGVFSVLSLVCKNCGYSIFHSLSILDK